MATYEDVDIFDVMKHMDIRDAIKLSLTDRRAYLISQTDMFWRFFLKRDYPLFVIDKDENLQSAYRKIDANRNVKEVTMKPGETFEQFKYHQNIDTFICKNIELKSLVGCPPCRILNCNRNRLTSLVGCPPNVKELDCDSNLLTSLVGCPPNLEKLFCDNNRLTSFVGCPPSVRILYFNDNRLTSFIGCPANIKKLYCSSNQLISLNGCPQDLEELYCDDNQLTSLVGCPESVKILFCFDNQLQTLDIYLPQIRDIDYENNPLIHPWDQYLRQKIIDIMRNPDYHQLN